MTHKHSLIKNNLYCILEKSKDGSDTSRITEESESGADETTGDESADDAGEVPEDVLAVLKAEVIFNI